MNATWILTIACAVSQTPERPVGDKAAENSARWYRLTDADRRTLPDVSTFVDKPTDRFLIDWEWLRTGEPYLGIRAGRPHTGAHLYFKLPKQKLDPKRPQDYPAIYAVADGIVARTDSAFRLRPVYFPDLGKEVSNVRYGVDIAIAVHDGREVTFHYSIEPMVDPGSAEFYKPFLLVEPGRKVKKGDVIARMYVPDDERSARNTHIHFNLNRGGQFQSPSIFTADTARKFHATFDERRLQKDWPVAPKLGIKLSDKENPFGTGEKDDL